MNDNKNNKNFFAKLGHSLNLESKRYNNTLKKSFANQEGTTPIDNTADLMSTDSMDEQPMESPAMDSMPVNNGNAEQQNQMPDAPANDMPEMPPMNAPQDMVNQPAPLNNDNAMNQPMPPNNAEGMTNNNDMESTASDVSDMGMDESDMEQMDDMNTDMDMMDTDDTINQDHTDEDEPDSDASLAATTVAKKHTTETKSMSAEQADGLLRPIDVYETKNEIIVKAMVAGVERSAIKVSLTAESVTISGERQKQERVARDSYFYQELFWGSFSRSIMLPVEVDPDNAKATLKNGIFTIRLPKIEQQRERILSMDDIEEG